MLCGIIVIAVFYSKLCRAGISKFVEKLKKSVALTHNIRGPCRRAGRASFRSGLGKVLGIAYIRKKFEKKIFGDMGFRRNGADELLHKRLRQASAPPRAMRKPVGIAYVGDVFSKTFFSEPLFGKVSKLSGKFRNFFGSYYARWATLVVACGKY